MGPGRVWMEPRSDRTFLGSHCHLGFQRKSFPAGSWFPGIYLQVARAAATSVFDQVSRDGRAVLSGRGGA